MQQSAWPHLIECCLGVEEVILGLLFEFDRLGALRTKIVEDISEHLGCSQPPKK